MTIQVNTTYTVADGQTLAFAKQPAFNLYQADAADRPTVLINGAVTVSAGRAVALAGVTADGAANHVRLAIAAEGSLAVSAAFGAIGASLSAAGVVENRGDVTITSRQGDAWGVRSTAPDQPLHGQQYDGYAAEFANYGTLEVSGEASATGFEADNSAAAHIWSGVVRVTSAGAAAGIVLHSWGDFDNRGSIEVTGGATAVGVRVSEDTDTFPPGMRNFGSVTVAATAPGGLAIGFDIAADASPVNLGNIGTIRAAVAIHDAITEGPDRGISVTNSGHIFGDIELGAGKDDVLNTGVIRGDIHLGADEDSYSGVYGQWDGGLSSGTLNGAAFGGAGADTLTGGRHSDVLWGGEGTAGAAGDLGDSLSGMGGNDTLAGEAGGDTLAGGEGADQLSGGAGGDLFVYTALADSAPDAPDLVTDLGAKDHIDLSAIDANTGKAGDQAFALVAALDGHAGQAALVYDAGAGETRLLLDVDGDGAPDAVVLMTGDQSGFSGLVL